MILASLDGKLFAFYYLEFFENNFIYIDPRDVIRPPFDASRHDVSADMCFILL